MRRRRGGGRRPETVCWLVIRGDQHRWVSGDDRRDGEVGEVAEADEKPRRPSSSLPAADKCRRPSSTYRSQLKYEKFAQFDNLRGSVRND